MSTRSEEDLIKMLADEVASVAYSNFIESFEYITRDTESPIERVLAMAWQARPIQGIEYFGNSDGVDRHDKHYLLEHSWDRSVDWVGSIHPQVQIGNYRTDFYLQVFGVDDSDRPFGKPAHLTRQCVKIAIECDGHDFHERTREQAARDKRRDRWFQIHGIIVLRFTGAEIWADPLGCIDQVHDALFEAWKRARL